MPAVDAASVAEGDALHLQLLTLALKNAGRSVLLLFLAGLFIAGLGWTHGARTASVVVLLLDIVVSGWRHALGRRGLWPVPVGQIVSLQRQLIGNSLLAGGLWAVATAAIYPHLPARDMAAHMVVLIGSAAIAGHFMTLVKGSYEALILPSIGMLAWVSAADDNVRSIPLIVLSLVYIVTLLVAGREYRKTAITAIGHALKAESVAASLRVAKEEAEAGTLAKSQFLATMSHEIRTPMNGILGSIDLLRCSGLNAQQLQLVRTAATSGTSLLAILNDVLDHSKIEAGQLQLMPSAISLHDTLASVVALLRPNAHTRGLDLDFFIEEGGIEWVVADGQRLKQVLLNLMSNAIKFTDRGGVSLRLQYLARDTHTVSLRVEVVDTGVGMSGDAVTRLFTPFLQFAAEGENLRRGTGLGLSISQRIIEAMGSRIRVESQPGQGSRFFFDLQFDQWTDEPPAARLDTLPGAFDGADGLCGTVLVVEDEPVNRSIARAMLESLGLAVVEAADGMEALAKARMHAFDLVFMDCQMPNLDGYATTRKWREREAQQGRRRVPIVALTANAFAEDLERATSAGMDDHLSKPYTRDQLSKKIGRWHVQAVTAG